MAFILLSLLFTCLAVAVILSYIYIKQKFKYWDDRRVPYLKPSFPMGNMSGLGQTITVAEMMKNFYFELKNKGPIGGIFFYTEPSAVVLDLDLLRNIFEKDFQHFHDRGMYINERDDPLSAHLFSLEGAPWRNMRAKLSPTFTSGKLKMMHSTLLTVADQFRVHLGELCGENGVELEVKSVLSEFLIDVIGNIAFGIDSNCMTDPKSEFSRISKKIFESSPTRNWKDFFTTMFPNASRFLRIRINSSEVTKYFMNLLRDTIKYREDNQIKGNDFLSLLIQIKNMGRLENEQEDLGKISFNELAAQVFLFFIAGYETTSATLMFTFYELALNQEFQGKARAEVQEVMDRHGTLTYEACLEMEFIEKVLNETLRKYPVGDTHIRSVTETYKVPDSDLILEKGMSVLIPVMGFHHDPDIYPNPDKFDPERFTKENIAARHPFAWIPFGAGPRNCIGLRLGMMQMRIAMATVLANYKITTSGRTLIPMKFQPDGQVICPVGGMYLNIEPLGK